MRKTLAILIIVPMLALSCATATQFVNTANTTLDYIKAAYDSAEAWYTANQSIFSAEDQAKLAKFRVDFVATYTALRAALAAYTAGSKKEIESMIAQLVTIAFSVIVIVQAHSKTFASATAKQHVSDDAKKAFVEQVGKDTLSKK